jgi:PAS domain S-box-containing protein
MIDVIKPDSKHDEPEIVTVESLRKSEERLALAIEGSGAGLWDWRVQTGEVEFNSRWAQIVGYDLQELAPLSINTWFKLVHPDALEMSNQLLQKCFNSELSVYECDVRMRHKDGQWLWVLSRGKVVEWGKDGRPVRMSGTHLDITERKQAEKTLRESEYAWRMIFDNTHDAIFVHAIDGRVLDVNRKMLELYRVSREQALQSSIAEDFSTSDNPIDQLQDRWNRVLAGESITFEWKARRPNDRSAFDVEVALKGISLGNRNVVLVNVRDISIRKSAEAFLKESEERYRSLFDHSRDAILLTKPDGSILDANPAACGMFGRSLEEIRKLGRNGLVDLTDPRLRAALKERALFGGSTACPLSGYQNPFHVRLHSQYNRSQGCAG